MDPLRALSLAISLANNDPTAADDRRNWTDYAWVEPNFGQCLARTDDQLCLASHQKWDWKRNQWVNFSYGVSPDLAKMTTRLQLVNNDLEDSDDVCVTALFVDQDGHSLYVFHQNWHILARQTLDRAFTAAIPKVVFADTVRVVIGSKQCRGGPHEDDDVFATAKMKIGQR